MKQFLLMFLLTMFLLSSCTTGVVNESKTAPTTVTIEKDLINLKDELLTLPLSVGVRVEVEIDNVHYTHVYIEYKVEKVMVVEEEYAPIYVTIRDPFGNIVIENFTTMITQTSPYILESRMRPKYPWRYAFLPATSGEFTINIHGGYFYDYSAHIKVTIYSKWDEE